MCHYLGSSGSTRTDQNGQETSLWKESFKNITWSESTWVSKCNLTRYQARIKKQIKEKVTLLWKATKDRDLTKISE